MNARDIIMKQAKETFRNVNFNINSLVATAVAAVFGGKQPVSKTIVITRTKMSIACSNIDKDNGDDSWRFDDINYFINIDNLAGECFNRLPTV